MLNSFSILHLKIMAIESSEMYRWVEGRTENSEAEAFLQSFATASLRGLFGILIPGYLVVP